MAKDGVEDQIDARLAGPPWMVIISIIVARYGKGG